MIEIAKILKPQGIKGEIKALPLTDVVELFDVLKECLVGNKTMRVERISFRQGFLYIKFDEIKTRNDAELYRNYSIKVEKKLLLSVKQDDALLVEDVIGMLLYDDKGNFVGQVMDIINYGATDIFVIEKEDRQYQVPFVDEVFMFDGEKYIVNSEKLEEVMV